MSQIFPADRQNRIFGVSPGRDFSHDIVEGLLERTAGHPPENLARITIFTNTQRAARRLETVFADHGALLLPQIRVITDLGNDPLLGPRPDLTEPPVAARLRMTQLVRKLLETETTLAPPVAAFDLAGSLSDLMDEMAGADVPPEAFDTLQVDHASRHWQTSLQFLRLIGQLWPADGGKVLGSDARQRQAVAALARRWQTEPPDHPVIIAGSTGSRASTRLLMEAVLGLPQGALVLPGYDNALNPRSWAILQDNHETTEDHPQFGFANLATTLGFDTTAVQGWRQDKSLTARNSLVSLALRPAPVTDEWRAEGPEVAPHLDAAFKGLTLMTARNEREEATAIATALRAALDTKQSAALITPDGTLARRVTAQLARWGILPDESAGQPLHLTPEGVFLGLILNWLDTPSPVTLIALLKHPLCATQGQRGVHLPLARRLDAEVLRDAGPVVNWAQLEDWALKQGDDAQGWIAWLHRSLAQPGQPDTSTLDTRVAQHRAMAEALSADWTASTPPTRNPFWTTEPGRATDRILTDLTDATEAAGPTNARDYATVFDTLLRAEKKRPEGYIPDQRVLIWGQLEARVQSADLVILGGLNEDTWPAQPAPDPWLSRAMRKDLGLQLPERRIGLAAHDFQQAACATEVILSRSARLDNTPTVPSRWLVRLENLVTGLGDAGKSVWDAAQMRGTCVIAQANALDQPTAPTDPAKRPAPVPPIAARPTRIYVTHAETLVRDPYAYYARHILRLRELSRAGRPADPRDRGNALHKVLEVFVKETQAALPADAQDRFRNIVALVLDQIVPWPAERRLWQARLNRLTADFIAAEATRRTIAQPADFETDGVIAIPGFSRPLELAAKADRIDLAPDGSVAIYDYKSRIDTRKQVLAFNKQLPLEAKMAAMGGFLDKAARQVAHLELIGLSQPGEAQDMTLSPSEIDDIWDEFLRLIAHYEDPTAPYPSRLRIMKERDAGTYDHLARRGEWADGDDYEPEPLS